MSELTHYSDASNTNTKKAFGWKNKDKSFVVGERDVTVAETAYAAPNSEMMLYASTMTWDGTSEGWLAEIPDNVYVRTALSIALASTIMRFMDEKSYIINFYGDNANVLVEAMNSVFGDPSRMREIELSTALPVFDNFPIVVDGLAFENPKLLKDRLGEKNKRIIGASPIPVPLAHPRVLNLPVEGLEQVHIAPKNYGVYIETFLKQFMSKHKFKPFDATGILIIDLMSMVEQACVDWEYLPIAQVMLDANRLKQSKEGLIMDFINENLDKVYVVNIPGQRIAVKVRVPDGPIYIRYEMQNKMLYIHRAIFREYYKKKDLTEALKVYWDTGAITEVKKKAMYGGTLVSARQYYHAFCVDSTKLIGFDLQEFLYGVGVWSQG